MKAKHGQLKIWWIPQIPMTKFTVSVNSLVEARLLLDTLAGYDLFQLKHRVKPDYSNVGGLLVFSRTENDWIDWLDEEGNDIDHYSLEELREAEKNSTLPAWEDA